MIPITGRDLSVDFTITEGPTYTYNLDTDLLTITGHTDELAAMVQAIYLILSIERYQYVIYNWDYGIELQDLIGQPVPFAIPEIKRRITEALLQDTRITAVTDFSFTVARSAVHVRFVANTVFGDVAAERAVSL